MLERTEAAILFPGQGCSVAGAREVVALYCAELYARARRTLGCDPLARAEEGTCYAQPAIFLASLAGWRAAQVAGVSACAFAGHSLGELTALTAAGVFAPEDGLELVILRGRLMEEAARRNPGGMIAVLKGTVEQAEWLAAECGLFVANYNAPGQTVLTGPSTALEAAAQVAREEGMRAMRLDVSGQFHSPAMSCVSEPFEVALRSAPRREPSVAVLSCMTAEPFRDPPAELSAALCAPVRWSETMAALAGDGMPSFLDVGPDHVLARLTSRNVPQARALGLEEIGVCV